MRLAGAAPTPAAASASVCTCEELVSIRVPLACTIVRGAGAAAAGAAGSSTSRPSNTCSTTCASGISRRSTTESFDGQLLDG